MRESLAIAVTNRGGKRGPGLGQWGYWARNGLEWPLNRTQWLLEHGIWKRNGYKCSNSGVCLGDGDAASQGRSREGRAGVRSGAEGKMGTLLYTCWLTCLWDVWEVSLVSTWHTWQWGPRNTVPQAHNGRMGLGDGFGMPLLPSVTLLLWVNTLWVRTANLEIGLGT